MRSDVNEMSRRENFIRPDLVYTCRKGMDFLRISKRKEQNRKDKNLVILQCKWNNLTYDSL